MVHENKWSYHSPKAERKNAFYFYEFANCRIACINDEFGHKVKVSRQISLSTSPLRETRRRYKQGSWRSPYHFHTGESPPSNNSPWRDSPLCVRNERDKVANRDTCSHEIIFICTGTIASGDRNVQ